MRAPAIDAGRYDLVLDPEPVARRCMSPAAIRAELDRALGYEANYTGTVFSHPTNAARTGMARRT